ncbi:hypothetical protein, partial [Pseudomonas syringae group genomosp. 3]|uniref:hypothetical protein n=1 Tax=Pseudomonas syringae group genomosp. 3 TaxID=251701 RepID=UPI001C7E85CB
SEHLIARTRTVYVAAALIRIVRNRSQHSPLPYFASGQVSAFDKSITDAGSIKEQLTGIFIYNQ